MKKNQIQYVIGIIFFFINFSLFGQGVDHSLSPEKLNKKVDEWVHGKIHFIDGTTISCLLSYNPLLPEGLVKVKEKNKILTYTVFDIDYFSYTDQKDASEHKYISLPVNNRNNVFIELILDNPYFTLLGRKTIYVIKNSQYNYTTSRIRLIYQRYIYDMRTEKYHALMNKSFLILMDDKKKEMKKFIKENKLKFKDTKDYILVVMEYERLVKSPKVQ